MIDFLGDIGSYFISIANLLLGFLSTFLESIVNGLSFVLNFFTVIPNFLIYSVFPNLPPFFHNSLYGLLGFMLFVLVAKIYFFLKG